MTLDDALRELLEGVAAGTPYVVGWQTTHKWPEGTVETLRNSGLLRTTNKAETAECYKCDQHCCLDVIPITHKDRPTRYFMVCEDSEMQGSVGRTEVPEEQLQQWRITTLQLGELVAKLLGFKNKVERQRNKNHIRIGMVDSGHGRKPLLLNQSPLALEINGNTITLDKALFYKDEQLVVDRSAIEAMAGLPLQLDMPVQKKDKLPSGATLHPLEVFRSMGDLKFSEINIRIDPDRQSLLISARGEDVRASFSNLNLTIKNTSTFSVQGKQLLAMGIGCFAPCDAGAKNAVARLSKSLREAFDTKDTPFIKLKPQFKLTIPKERLAEQEALKRTSTYNDGIAISTNDYFKSCDPEYDPNNPTYDDLD